MADFKNAMKMNYGQGLDQDSILDLALETVGNLKKQGKEVGEPAARSHPHQFLRSFSCRKRSAKNTRDLSDDQALPKFGNDIDEVDEFAREAAYCYSKPIETYRTRAAASIRPACIRYLRMYRSARRPAPRRTGVWPTRRWRTAFHPMSARIQRPDRRLQLRGESGSRHRSNGTLFNMKFHPSALSGQAGLDNFVNMIRGFFDQKGMHMQFNVVDKQTLLDAQKHPEKYQHLVVRVAGYSALFTTLSRSLQDDIISRTEQTSSYTQEMYGRSYLTTKGRIFDIQRYSIHDGNGIRTIVFLKGCFLRCRWCCNPESQRHDIETMIVQGKEKVIGRDVTVAEVMETVEKDRVYYRRSGLGGMTLSGGEILFQPEFALALLKGAKDHGLTTAVESTANADWSKIEPLLPYLDQYLMDIKHMNSKKHREYTGVPTSGFSRTRGRSPSQVRRSFPSVSPPFPASTTVPRRSRPLRHSPTSSRASRPSTFCLTTDWARTSIPDWAGNTS